ncbi:unnamed protein product [Effrenium voratum]|uniref:Uncharacterized protein n=1 Tax=Effrenium voratum TaxID=2562239 RepID=A0AA36MI57_9DINO|nr:unnamed protein product [Effrenium voratum]
MRNGKWRHGHNAIWCLLLACGVGCFVAPARVGLYRVRPQRCQACLRLSLKNVSFWEVAGAAANATNSATGSYLEEVNRTATKFLQSRAAVDREDAVANLSKHMTIQGKLCLVLGGRNLGKTLLKEKAISRLKANVNILSVDMRDADMLGKGLMTALDLQRQNSLGWARLAVEVSRAIIQLPVDYALNRIRGAGAAAKEVLDVAVSRHQINVNNFISQSISRRKIPSIIIDDANLALPGITGEDGSAAAKSALQAITKWTKQTGQASVMMISSEFGYPFRLLANGLALSTIGRVIVIGEVPKYDMLKMLQEDWGMDADLANIFYKYFGGDIYTTKQALDMLMDKKDKFNPFAVVDCPGLPSCVEDPEARAHLENMAKQGFSPVRNVKTDKGARMIAEENVGGVIKEGAITFGLPDIFTNTSCEWAVIPSSYHMRLKIADKLKNIFPSGTDATAPRAVWVRQLSKPRKDYNFDASVALMSLFKDGKEFELIGNAFKITASVVDVDDLKEAIEKKEKLTIAASKIDVYRQKDGGWVKEEKMSASLRDTDEADCYGFVLPSAGVASA